MRDFLDNLVDRHLDATPQIKPRLPSIFEPEISHGGLNMAVHDDSALEIEETNFPGPLVRMKERVPSHSETTKSPFSEQGITSTASRTAIEPVQPTTAPVVGWHQQKRPPEAMVNEGPKKPSVPQKEEGRGMKISPAQTVPAREEQQAADIHLTQRASSREQMGRVRHAHREERMEPTFPITDATAEEQTSVREGLNKPAFSLSPRERARVTDVNSTSDPLTLTFSQRERGHNQGLLKPSATLIAPVIPALAGPERPVSRPEPVINVPPLAGSRCGQHPHLRRPKGNVRRRR
jgi:hypothetical protein